MKSSKYSSVSKPVLHKSRSSSHKKQRKANPEQPSGPWVEIRKQIISLSGKLKSLSRNRSFQSMKETQMQRKKVTQSTLSPYKSQRKDKSFVGQKKSLLSIQRSHAQAEFQKQKRRKNSDKKQKASRKTQQAQINCRDQIDHLTFINCRLRNEKNELEKQLQICNLQNRMMAEHFGVLKCKETIEEFMKKFHEFSTCQKQQKSSTGHNLSQNITEYSNNPSVFSSTPPKRKQVMDLSKRYNKIARPDLLDLQKKFNELVEKSRLERNRLKKKDIWSEMRGIAFQIKETKNL